MTTSEQIQQHVSATFNGMRAQISYHGCERGSVQVFTLGGDLVIDIDTAISGRSHDVELDRLDQMIRAEFPRLIEG